jgi:hypothetical protein
MNTVPRFPRLSWLGWVGLMLTLGVAGVDASPASGHASRALVVTQQGAGDTDLPVSEVFDAPVRVGGSRRAPTDGDAWALHLTGVLARRAALPQRVCLPETGTKSRCRCGGGMGECSSGSRDHPSGGQHVPWSLSGASAPAMGRRTNMLARFQMPRGTPWASSTTVAWSLHDRVNQTEVRASPLQLTAHCPVASRATSC